MYTCMRGTLLLLRATAKNSFLARSGCTLQQAKNLFTPRVDEVCSCAVKARSETQGLEWVCLWCKIGGKNKKPIKMFSGEGICYLICFARKVLATTRNNMCSRLITRCCFDLFPSHACTMGRSVENLPLHPEMSPRKRCCHHSIEFLPLD